MQESDGTQKDTEEPLYRSLRLELGEFVPERLCKDIVELDTAFDKTGYHLIVLFGKTDAVNDRRSF
jgi:hypothetical protein